MPGPAVAGKADAQHEANRPFRFRRDGTLDAKTAVGDREAQVDLQPVRPPGHMHPAVRVRTDALGGPAAERPRARIAELEAHRHRAERRTRRPGEDVPLALGRRADVGRERVAREAHGEALGHGRAPGVFRRRRRRDRPLETRERIALKRAESPFRPAVARAAFRVQPLERNAEPVRERERRQQPDPGAVDLDPGRRALRIPGPPGSAGRVAIPDAAFEQAIGAEPRQAAFRPFEVEQNPEPRRVRRPVGNPHDQVAPRRAQEFHARRVREDPAGRRQRAQPDDGAPESAPAAESAPARGRPIAI